MQEDGATRVLETGSVRGALGVPRTNATRLRMRAAQHSAQNAAGHRNFVSPEFIIIYHAFHFQRFLRAFPHRAVDAVP